MSAESTADEASLGANFDNIETPAAIPGISSKGAAKSEQVRQVSSRVSPPPHTPPLIMLCALARVCLGVLVSGSGCMGVCACMCCARSAGRIPCSLPEEEAQPPFSTVSPAILSPLCKLISSKNIHKNDNDVKQACTRSGGCKGVGL